MGGIRPQVSRPSNRWRANAAATDTGLTRPVLEGRRMGGVGGEWEAREKRRLQTGFRMRLQAEAVEMMPWNHQRVLGTMVWFVTPEVD